ncbi:MAG: hypothetical protein KJ600_02385 [Nanoarchaeota archaeon]|nr:hypothetical protein [Nanoarchaeota archaeon]
MNKRVGSYKKISKNILQLISKHYSYLALREREFQKMSSSLQNDLDKIKNDEGFISHVLKSLFVMKDSHLRIIDKTGKKYWSLPNKKTNYKRQLLGNYFKQLKKYGVITIAAKGDIFYLAIDSFANRYKSDFNELYNGLNFRKFQKWIIDLRANSGGDESLADRLISNLAGEGNCFISSYTRIRTNKKNPRKFSQFIPKYILPGGKYPKRNVMVLIGNNTYSSAELITLDLAAIPGTVLIGDTTGGGSGHPERYLTDGPSAGKKIEKKEAPSKYNARFALDIPSLLQYRLDKFLLQDNGITPHILIPSSKSVIGRKDIVLEKALELHKNQTL